jgi:hypothetical protein
MLEMAYSFVEELPLRKSIEGGELRLDASIILHSFG